MLQYIDSMQKQSKGDGAEIHLWHAEV